MQTKKIRIVAGILIALCAPLVSFAADFRLGQGLDTGTTTPVYAYLNGMGYEFSLRQVLPEGLSGQIGTFVVIASGGDYDCYLEASNGNFYHSTTTQNSLQVLCDFRGMGLSFNPSLRYYLWVRNTSETVGGLIWGSTATTTIKTFGFNGIVYTAELPPTEFYNGIVFNTTRAVHTLNVTFSATGSNAFAQDFDSALGVDRSCSNLDVLCQMKAFALNLITPSASVTNSLVWETASYKTAFPFAIFYAVSDAFSVLSSLTSATTTGATVIVPLGTGVASSSLTLPSITTAITPASGLFSSIRTWVEILLKIFVIFWTIRILLSIVGIGGSVGSGGRLLHSSVGSDVIRHTRNWR